MSARHYRRVAAIALVTTVGLGLAACGSSNNNSSASSSGGKTTLIVDCAPQKTDNGGKTLAQWNTDIANFEKLHSGVEIKSISVGAQCDVPADFTARLQGGTQEADVFYGYMTDLEQVLDADQAADITSYVSDSTVPGWSQITDSAKKAFTENGKGRPAPFPRAHDGSGLQQEAVPAGRHHHPAGNLAGRRGRCEEDRRAEQWRVGLQEYSSGNTGGWHFTAELYSRGGADVSADGKTATVDTPEGEACVSSCTTCDLWRTVSARSSCSAGPTPPRTPAPAGSACSSSRGTLSSPSLMSSRALRVPGHVAMPGETAPLRARSAAEMAILQEG